MGLDTYGDGASWRRTIVSAVAWPGDGPDAGVKAVGGAGLGGGTGAGTLTEEDTGPGRA